jgi:hypothetical protein
LADRFRQPFERFGKEEVMATKVEDPDQLVDDAVSAAEEARAQLAAMNDSVMAGEDKFSHSDLSNQKSFVSFAEKLIEGAKAKAEKIRTEREAKARQALREEILSDAPENGEHVLALIDSLVTTGRDLVEVSKAHSAQVRSWGLRALELGAPHLGVASEEHAGLGVSAAGDVLVDDIQVQTIDAKNILGLLFHEVQNGIMPVTDETTLVAARSIAANLGKATV